MFKARNELDAGCIGNILEFVGGLSELNVLAGLISSSSDPIGKQLYRENLIWQPFGICLALYSWSDWIWKDFVMKKIEFINGLKITQQFDEIHENFRKNFILQVWNRVDQGHFNTLEKKRQKNKSIIQNHIDNMMKKIDDRNVCKILKEHINKSIFLNVENIPRHLNGPLVLKTNNQESDEMKIVMVGDRHVGKFSLSIRITVDMFPSDYRPCVFENIRNERRIEVLEDGIPKQVKFITEFWDTNGSIDYARLRPLSYYGTDVFLLIYSMNDWKSFEFLFDTSIIETTRICPTATFILVSTKNDLYQELVWKSLFDPSVEEPILKSDAIEFSKQIGSISLFETSSLNGKGTSKFAENLARLRHFHLTNEKQARKKQDKCILN